MMLYTDYNNNLANPGNHNKQWLTWDKIKNISVSNYILILSTSKSLKMCQINYQSLIDCIYILEVGQTPQLDTRRQCDQMSTALDVKWSIACCFRDRRLTNIIEFGKCFDPLNSLINFSLIFSIRAHSYSLLLSQFN